MVLRRLGPRRAVSSSSAPIRLPSRHSVWTLACSPQRAFGTIATTTALSAPRAAPTAWTTAHVAARACRKGRPLRRGPSLVLAARTPNTRMASLAPTAPTTARASCQPPAQPPCVLAVASARRHASTTPTAMTAAPSPSSRCALTATTATGAPHRCPRRPIPLALYARTTATTLAAARATTVAAPAPSVFSAQHAPS